METQNIEYKETLASGKIKEDITMFANSDGGEIWVGYKDDGSAAKKFIYNQASLDQFINEVKIKISPPITSITIEYPTRENLSVGLILKVGKSYCDHHRYNEQLWVRSGTTRIRASIEEFKLREMKQSKKDYTGIAVSPKGRKSTLEDLDPKALEFLKEKLSGKNPEYRDKEIKHILVAEDLMDGDSPNFTACLFLGKYEKRHEILPREVSSIHYLYEDEKNKTEERFELELPWILNLPKLFTEINKRNFTLQDIDLFRPTEKQYSEKAVEEAVINAIAHRNWLISSWIEIIHTPTKLQIFNPGIFKPKLSDILSQDKNYDYLNPTLCAFLKTVNLMERERRGIKKKIYLEQINRGLTIEVNQQEAKNGAIERVEFLLNGRISNLNFAKLVYLYSPDINLEQLQVLDKIASGKNIMGTDISEKDFDLIKSFVTKNRGKSGKISIKSILSNNKPLQLNDASMKSLESLILDYAKEKFKNENKIFSLNDIYARFDANKNTIRAILSDLKSNGILVRTSVGKYSLKK